MACASWLMNLGFAGGGVVTVEPDIEGAEFILPEQRGHYAMPSQLPHWVLPDQRGHYAIPGED